MDLKHLNIYRLIKLQFLFLPIVLYLCALPLFPERTFIGVLFCIITTYCFSIALLIIGCVAKSSSSIYHLISILFLFILCWTINLLAYGYCYYLHGAFEGQHLTGDEGKLDYFQSIYFSAVTMSTLGYGDLVPTSTATRLCAIFQSLLGIILMISFIAVFMRTLQQKSKN